MKNQNLKNPMKTLMFSALAALVMMTTACDKKSNNNTAAPVQVIPQGCYDPACTGGIGGVAGGQLLYGGQTTNGMYAQAQFQVYGTTGGNGPASITGSVAFNNFVCQVGVPSLNGPFQMQMAQQGSMMADVFQGYVALVGPQGTIQAAIQTVPTRTPGTGMISIYLCNQRLDMNF